MVDMKVVSTGSMKVACLVVPKVDKLDVLWAADLADEMGLKLDALTGGNLVVAKVY